MGSLIITLSYWPLMRHDFKILLLWPSALSVSVGCTASLATLPKSCDDIHRREGGREGERDGGGLAICAKLICQLSAAERLFREFRPLTATHFSTLTRPSDASVGNLRTGSSKQSGSQPNIRVSFFVHHISSLWH